MKTQLCIVRGELVPQGCCTCGDRQELKPLSKASPELADAIADALASMLAWHDAVRQEVPFIPSPYNIEKAKAAHAAWEEAGR